MKTVLKVLFYGTIFVGVTYSAAQPDCLGSCSKTQEFFTFIFAPICGIIATTVCIMSFGGE